MKHTPAHEIGRWIPDTFDPRFEHCGHGGCKAVRRVGAPLPPPPEKKTKRKGRRHDSSNASEH